MAEEKKSTNWGAIITGGCGCFLFGIGMLVVVLYFVVVKTTEAPELVVQEFLVAAGSGDVEGAHEYFSSALKEVQPLEDFRAVVEQNPHLFQVAETTFTERSRDMAKASFRGTVTLQDGSELSAEFILIEEDDTWKLIKYDIGGTE